MPLSTRIRCMPFPSSRRQEWEGPPWFVVFRLKAIVRFHLLSVLVDGNMRA